MGKLSSDDIRHVAKLSKLKLKGGEIEKFKKQLSNILDHMDILKEVDTSKVSSTSQTTGLVNVLRKDVVKVKECLSQKEALSGSDNTHNGYFKVPAVLKK